MARQNNINDLTFNVEEAVRAYLKDLDGELPCNLFDTVISQIEKPQTLLRVIITIEEDIGIGGMIVRVMECLKLFIGQIRNFCGISSRILTIRSVRK